MAMVSINQSAWRCPRSLISISLSARCAGLNPTDGRRTYRSSARHHDDAEQPSQAQPLSGYYADILNATEATHPPRRTKTPADMAKIQTKEDRARVVFGSRLAGSGYERRSSETPDATWRTINGVPVPPRPAEPDNCCMSGCVHCVWDDYRDEVEGWATRLQEAQAKGGGSIGASGRSVSAKVELRRNEVAAATASMDDDGGGSETNWGAIDPAQLFSSIPVGIREFMRTEKRLKERQKREKPIG